MHLIEARSVYLVKSPNFNNLQQKLVAKILMSPFEKRCRIWTCSTCKGIERKEKRVVVSARSEEKIMISFAGN